MGRTLLFVWLIAVLVSAACAGVWIRSYRLFDAIYLGQDNNEYVHLIAQRGSLMLIRSGTTPPAGTRPQWWLSYTPEQFARATHAQGSSASLDFRLIDGHFPGVSSFKCINNLWWLSKDKHIQGSSIPIGALPPIPIGLAAIVSPFGILKTRRRKRMGLCIHCGYDLRASGSICPECGIETGLRKKTPWLTIGFIIFAGIALLTLVAQWPAHVMAADQFVGYWSTAEPNVGVVLGPSSEMVDLRVEMDRDGSAEFYSTGPRAIIWGEPQNGQSLRWHIEGDLVVFETLIRSTHFIEYSNGEWPANARFLFRYFYQSPSKDKRQSQESGRIIVSKKGASSPH